MSFNILVVEDEVLLREMALLDLEDLGHNTFGVGDYDAAVEALQGDQRFDAMITDIRIPGAADGWELARQARARFPDLKIVYISGYSGKIPQLVEGSIFVKKPYRVHEMERALEQASSGLDS